MTPSPKKSRKRPAARHAPTVADYASSSPHSIRCDRTLGDALRLMRENRIRHLPVLDGGRIVGIVSERDLLLVESIRDVDPETVPVEQAMTPDPYLVERDTPVLSAALKMWKGKLGSAVVMEKRRLVGVFTTTDALQALIELLSHQPALLAEQAEHARLLELR